MSVTRLASLDDAEEITSVLCASREFLAPWEPARGDEYFTVDVQRAILRNALDAHARGAMVPLAILDADGSVAGRLNINGITRGALQSAVIGFWVGKSHNGRGLATAALADAVGIAFSDLGLHRLQAETLLHNTASQRVLARNGFEPYGIAPKYLKIAGAWQDHILFHLFNPGMD